MSDTGTNGQQTSGIPGWVWGMLAGVLIFVAGYFIGGIGDSDTVDVGGGTFAEESAESAATTTTEAGSGEAAETSVLVEEAPLAEQFSDLSPVFVTELPLEAIDTLELIASGGPYPFDRDGLTFQNREGILPDLPSGHYQEFTVITPGLSHRGAKRIVAGADGELYYTSDHYDSFTEIVLED